MNAPSPVAELSPRDKKIVISGLTLVAGVSWLYMFYMAWAMENMHLVDMWMPPMGGMPCLDGMGLPSCSFSCGSA